MNVIPRFAVMTCGAPRDCRNQRRIFAWMAAWVSSWLGVNVAISYDWLATGWPAALGTILPLALGASLFVAFRRYLREADELRRKIELDALATAFGIGVVGGLTYWLLERAGVVQDAPITVLVSAMLVTYSAAVLRGQARYA